jgi:hypothetical protein
MRAGLKHKLGLTVTFRDQMHRVPDFLAPKPTDIAYYAWIDNYYAQNPLNPLIQAVFLLAAVVIKVKNRTHPAMSRVM